MTRAVGGPYFLLGGDTSESGSLTRRSFAELDGVICRSFSKRKPWDFPENLCDTLGFLLGELLT